jgi:Na+/citrate or Na+/malate symporter
MERLGFTNQSTNMMRNILVVLTTIASGLAYGWLLCRYPIAAQIIAGGMGLSILFIMMVGLYKVYNKKDE